MKVITPEDVLRQRLIDVGLFTDEEKFKTLLREINDAIFCMYEKEYSEIDISFLLEQLLHEHPLTPLVEKVFPAVAQYLVVHGCKIEITINDLGDYILELEKKL